MKQQRSLSVVGLFLMVSTGALAATDTPESGIHGVREGKSSYEQLSSLGMQERLIATAQQFEEIGPLARVSHHDMAYPNDSDEYVAMNGFGILWVTSHSQLQEELPLKNMRISIDGGDTIGLERIFLFSTIEEDALVSSVLGEYRSDAIYLVPFYKEVAGGVLVTDYAINRTDFVLGEFESSFPVELGPLKSLDTNGLKHPDRSVFLSMLKREYPIAMPILSEEGRPPEVATIEFGGGTYTGEVLNGIPHGQGTWADSIGNKYVGEWLNGKTHGTGTYTYDNGDWYTGEYLNDLRHGQGTYSHFNGEKYVGEWKNGKNNGYGIKTWPNGDKYVGEYRDNKKHGQGTLTWANGDQYIGVWKDGIEHGQGTFTFADGDKYVGDFKDGKRHGEGTHTKPDGLTYVGEWKGGAPNGQGTWADSAGNRYIGEFKDGEFHGQGTLTSADGKKYVGEYKNDKRNGQGTYIWPDGAKYVGGYKDDKHHGQGTYTFGKGKWEGAKYVGDHKDGKRHGHGTYTSASGSGYVGKWKDDRPWTGTYFDKDGKLITTLSEGVTEEN